MGNESPLCCSRGRKSPDWCIDASPLQVDGLSRLETEKQPAQWGRVEANHSGISYLDFILYY